MPQTGCRNLFRVKCTVERQLRFVWQTAQLTHFGHMPGTPTNTMTKQRQIAVWTGLWGFWGVVSRNNHPTLLLNGLATGLLLVAYAAAIYVNWRVLVPRYWRPGRFPTYWASLLLVMNALTVLDVVAIKEVYDVLWGPDPDRFGFWVNYGLEFAGMSLHLLAAAGLVWLLRRRRRGLNA